MSLRKLNAKEIEILKKHECFADNWETISVKDGFNPENIRNVPFSGNVLLGKFTDMLTFPDGLENTAVFITAICKIVRLEIIAISTM